MSHFTVMVVASKELVEKRGDIQEAVAELMAPFQENNMGNCPAQFLEFHDLEDEYKKDYEEDKWDGYVKIQKNGKPRYLSPYSSEFDKITRPIINTIRDKYEQKGKKKDPFWGLGHPTPKIAQRFAERELKKQGWEKIEIPMKERYPTFEEYVLGWHGDMQRDPGKGRFGYWENPNAKWDYWRIGGRWRGSLRVKEMALAQKGDLAWEHTVDGERYIDQPHTADLAQVKDIDFEGMELESHTKLDEFWNKVLKIRDTLKDLPPNPTREEIMASFKDKESQRTWVDAETGVLWNLIDMGLAEWTEDKKKSTPKHRVARLSLVDIFYEDFKKRFLSHFGFSTFAVCNEKGWWEQGKMGWWACSSETPKEYEEWHRSFIDKFVKDLDPETWVAICDCHI